jgi:branched-chain amino acid transport system substrate-binding protein
VKRAAVAFVAAAFVLAAALSGCGSKSKVGDRISGRTLTLYISVPMHGASRVNAQAVVSAAHLALSETRGRIGKYRIVLKVLDDSTVQRGHWDPGQTTVNARLAVADKTTIGYIGEFNSGASAISIPILNRVGIAQISPASTAVGLTSRGSGASPGEPQKYYPTGVRTYARIVPNDAIQAIAQVKLQKSLGCRKTYVVDDGEVDGADTANSFSLAAQSASLQVVGVQAFEPSATDFSSLATGVAQSGADCVLISAITESNAVLVTRQIAAALPAAKIFATAGVAESTYTDPTLGGIPIALDPRVMITAPTLGPSGSPPAGRRFYALYAQRYGTPEPYAIYGYEAMSLMLNAIGRATEHGTDTAQRSKVVAAIFSTRDRRSVLGTYSIDSNGDTTLHRYGVYRVLAGALSFWKAIDA